MYSFDTSTEASAPAVLSCRLSAVDVDSTDISSTTALGAITGILLVALVAVVTTWIISCVYAKRFVCCLTNKHSKITWYIYI